MSELTVRCTVEDLNYSACGLAVGDYFDLSPTGLTVPDGKRFCYFALASVIPAVLGRPAAYLRSGPLLACPDPPENVHIRVSVLEEDS